MAKGRQATERIPVDRSKRRWLPYRGGGPSPFENEKAERTRKTCGGRSAARLHYDRTRKACGGRSAARLHAPASLRFGLRSTCAGKREGEISCRGCQV